ncbi:MAG: hypothetical protein WCC64_14375 [Aliidongia sp.]
MMNKRRSARTKWQQDRQPGKSGCRLTGAINPGEIQTWDRSDEKQKSGLLCRLAGLCTILIAVISCNTALGEGVQTIEKQDLNIVAEVHLHPGINHVTFQGVAVPHPADQQEVVPTVPTTPGEIIVFVNYDDLDRRYQTFIAATDTGEYGRWALRGDLVAFPILQNATLPTVRSAIPGVSGGLSEISSNYSGYRSRTIHFVHAMIKGKEETVFVLAEVMIPQKTQMPILKTLKAGRVHISIFELIFDKNDVPVFSPTIEFDSSKKYCLPDLALSSEIGLKSPNKDQDYLIDDSLRPSDGCPVGAKNGESK